MSDKTYQVYFTNKSGEREYLKQNFYIESKAQEALERLVDQGFADAAKVGFTFTVEAYTA